METLFAFRGVVKCSRSLSNNHVEQQLRSIQEVVKSVDKALFLIREVQDERADLDVRLMPSSGVLLQELFGEIAGFDCRASQSSSVRSGCLLYPDSIAVSLSLLMTRPDKIVCE